MAAVLIPKRWRASSEMVFNTYNSSDNPYSSSVELYIPDSSSESYTAVSGGSVVITSCRAPFGRVCTFSPSRRQICEPAVKSRWRSGCGPPRSQISYFTCATFWTRDLFSFTRAISVFEEITWKLPDGCLHRLGDSLVDMVQGKTG